MARLKTELTVYSRAGCHLCDALIDELTEFCRCHPFSYTTIEISGNDELEQRYGLKVPVVAYQDHVLCEYFFDSQVITAYFGKSAEN